MEAAGGGAAGVKLLNKEWKLVQFTLVVAKLHESLLFGRFEALAATFFQTFAGGSFGLQESGVSENGGPRVVCG